MQQQKESVREAIEMKISDMNVTLLLYVCDMKSNAVGLSMMKIC